MKKKKRRKERNVEFLVFRMNETETKRARAWLKKHECKYWSRGGERPGKVGAIGGAMKYIFTQTTLGAAVEVGCACGASENVTEYDW